MILTNCAACAAPLPHIAKQCSRCKTRYCGPACQVQHWNAGGHKDYCKLIKKGGGAEQYNANKKYKETVAEAVEACAADTKGQKCYICLEAVHSRTGEGLVRGCACGDRDGVSSPELGVAHVSCLARQAKILYEEAEENNLGVEALNARWLRWCTCSLCEQQYHGIVRCALGWACWKTYVGRPEGDRDRIDAMTSLGNGLSEPGLYSRYTEALAVYEASLAQLRRLGRSEDSEAILVRQANIAYTLSLLGRDEEALELERMIYRKQKASYGDSIGTIKSAINLAASLQTLDRCAEARALLQETIPVAQRNYGPDHDLTLCCRRNCAEAVYTDPKSSLADLRRAETTLNDVYRRARRVFGAQHPETSSCERRMRELEATLAERNSGGS